MYYIGQSLNMGTSDEPPRNKHKSHIMALCTAAHLEPLADGLDGAAAALLRDGLPGARVVEVGGDVELQQRSELADDVLRRAVLLLPLEPVVRLYDLRQLVRQVVLAPVARAKTGPEL